ncbi:MAG: carboxylating nicotinate-nucleotide diphosphorylase [Planctomycetes bacterium]|nr:carboxylating nicotinate-nucleotide diphosphorylase [Planctomycetota bacterium]
MSLPPPADLDATLRRFLAEDLGSGDVTAHAFVPAGAPARATLTAKAPGALCGVDLALRIVRLLDPEARLAEAAPDGTRVVPGQAVGTLQGDARALLAAERTLLNLLQHLSGIATATARYVAAVAGTGAEILDTRKTVPGLRWFAKRAVAAGGGVNHRHGLWDQVLLKSNHLAWTRPWPAGRRPLEEAIATARRAAPAGMKLQLEVFDGDEAVRAAEAGADLVLLDNFTPEQVAAAVARVRSRFPRAQVGLEASGGLHLGNVRAYAEAGVDRLSIGALTHSAPALDLSLVFAGAGLDG